MNHTSTHARTNINLLIFSFFYFYFIFWKSILVQITALNETKMQKMVNEWLFVFVWDFSKMIHSFFNFMHSKLYILHICFLVLTAELRIALSYEILNRYYYTHHSQWHLVFFFVSWHFGLRLYQRCFWGFPRLNFTWPIWKRRTFKKRKVMKI